MLLWGNTNNFYIYLVMLFFLLKHKPILGWSGFSLWSRLGLYFRRLVGRNSIGRDFRFWKRWLSWQFERLEGLLGVLGRNWGGLELLDVLDVQVRNQVASS